MTAEAVHDGGCMCGAVRYRLTGPPRVVLHCHCQDCRRASAAPLVTWAIVRRQAVDFVTAPPTYRRSSERGVRGFCGACGTPLTCEFDEHPDWIDITVCSLDEPASMTPERHMWTRSAIAWATLEGDDLPRHPMGSTKETA